MTIYIDGRRQFIDGIGWLEPMLNGVCSLGTLIPCAFDGYDD